jgi:uncharacterized protein YgiM (DUF1202 family)
MLRIALLGVIAGLVAMALLPGTDDPAQANAVAGTRAEVQLITSLRELAQVPEGAADMRVALLAPEPGVAQAAAPVVEIAATPAAERLVVTSDALNLRARPSSDAEVLGRLLRGEAVEVAGREGGWVQVATADGATGWAYSDYLAVATE